MNDVMNETETTEETETAKDAGTIEQIGYFRLERRAHGVFRIAEPLGVGESLIVGSERALLVDTGYGLCDIRPVLARATSLPIIVMNTHVHTDHSGGNRFFERVLVPEAELGKPFDGSLVRERASLFGSLRKSRPHLISYLDLREEPTPAGIETAYAPLPGRLDLGGRAVELFTLGGHTLESKAVIDRNSRTAFVGDAVGPLVWLFLHPSGKVADYAEKLRAFSRIDGVDWLQLSHKAEPMPFAFAAFYAEFVLRASVERARLWENERFAGPIYQYAEEDTPYGAVSVLFRPSNL